MPSIVLDGMRAIKNPPKAGFNPSQVRGNRCTIGGRVNKLPIPATPAREVYVYIQRACQNFVIKKSFINNALHVLISEKEIQLVKMMQKATLSLQNKTLLQKATYVTYMLRIYGISKGVCGCSFCFRVDLSSSNKESIREEYVGEQ